MINIVVIFSLNLSKKHSPRVKITSIPSWLHYNFDIALNKGQCSGKLTCTFCLLKIFKFAGVLNNNCTYLERTQAFCHDFCSLQEAPPGDIETHISKLPARISRAAILLTILKDHSEMAPYGKLDHVSEEQIYKSNFN